MSTRYAVIVVLTLIVWLQPAVAEEGVQFEVCYDFGCRTKAEINLSNEEWQSVQEIFTADNPIDERKQMKLAVARMEVLAGQYSPIHQDLAMNMPVLQSAADALNYSGQLDCIDESINTTLFLQMFSDHGWLQFHSVLDRAYRRSFITQHWAAQVEDRLSGERYVIDSWFDENGALPVLVSSKRWHDLSL